MPRARVRWKQGTTCISLKTARDMMTITYDAWSRLHSRWFWKHERIRRRSFGLTLDPLSIILFESSKIGSKIYYGGYKWFQGSPHRPASQILSRYPEEAAPFHIQGKPITLTFDILDNILHMENILRSKLQHSCSRFTIYGSGLWLPATASIKFSGVIL